MYTVFRFGLVGAMWLAVAWVPVHSNGETLVRENLPERVGDWKRWNGSDVPCVFYGRKKVDLGTLLGPAAEEFSAVTGTTPTPGVIFVMERPSDAAKIIAAVEKSGEGISFPDAADFGDELTREQAFAMMPCPISAGAAADLLGQDPSDLGALGWHMALPTRASQKRVLKELIKQQMKEEDVNLAMRLLIRPLLGKITSMALDAMEPAAQAMVFEQWLRAAGVSASEIDAHVKRYVSRLENETEEKAEAMARELESSAGAMGMGTRGSGTAP